MQIRLAFLMIILIPSAHAQENDDFFRSDARKDRFEAGAPMPAGIIGPVYNPELEAGVKGSVGLIFKMKRNNDYLQHSYINVSPEINKEGSFRLFSNAEVHFLDDFIILTFFAGYRNMIDHYWGVGVKNANSLDQGVLTTEYERQSFGLEPSLLFRTFNKLYLGIIFENNYFQATNQAPLMFEDPFILKYGTEIRSSGLGFRAFYDKRGRYNPVSKGFYLNVEMKSFPEFLKRNDYAYGKLKLEYVHHIPVVREGSMLRLDFTAISSWGDVPWNEMPAIHRLNGYHEGKYRDKSALWLIAAYRHFLNNKSIDNISRHGLFYKIGGGSVFDKLSEPGTPVFSTGGGYLFHYLPNILLSAEIFFGTENVGFTFGLNEIF